MAGSAFSKAGGMWGRALPLIILLIIVNSVFFVYVYPIVEQMIATVSFAMLDLPPTIPLAKTPFYLYSQMPGEINLLFVTLVLNVFVLSIFLGLFTAFAKEGTKKKFSYSDAMKITTKRSGGIIAIAILLMVLFAVLASFTWFLSFLVGLTTGYAAVALTIIFAVLILSAWVMIFIKLFVAYPLLVIEGENAKKALRQSSLFSRKHTWSIFLTLVGLFIILFVAGLIQGAIVDFAGDDQLLAAVGSGIVSGLFLGYVFLVPSYYYLENK